MSNKENGDHEVDVDGEASSHNASQHDLFCQSENTRDGFKENEGMAVVHEEIVGDSLPEAPVNVSKTDAKTDSQSDSSYRIMISGRAVPENEVSFFC